MPPLRAAFSFLVALLLLTGGSAAADAATDKYEVLWSELRSDITSEGHVLAGASKTLKVDVSQENLTAVEFLLTWVETDDELRMTRDDTFRLSVLDPQGNGVGNSPATGSSGILSVEATGLSRIPPPMSLTAESQQAAEDQARAHASTAGMGAWRVTVDLLDTGNPSGAEMDTGNRFVLTVVLYYYEAGIFRVVSLEQPKGQGLLQSVGGDEDTWMLSTLGLTGAAALLGGFIIADRAGWNPLRKK